MEWLYEEGIGECRAALVNAGRILEARIEREGDHVLAGAVVEGRLVRTLIPKKRGIVRLHSGQEVLLEPIPPRLAEGGMVLVEMIVNEHLEWQDERRLLVEMVTRYLQDG